MDEYSHVGISRILDLPYKRTNEIIRDFGVLLSQERDDNKSIM